MPTTITAVDAFQLRIPLEMWAEPPLFAGRPRTHVEAVYVRVMTDKGVVGWGECNGFSGAAAVAAVETVVRRLAVGQDPTDPELSARIERLLHGLGRAGVIMHAISGLDIALWDIRGKLEGVSVSKLLGGAKRRRVETYASLIQYAGNIDNVKRNTARALERGYRHIKLHERTPEAVAAARA
jgi:L-alanine-DL-glutamate epimerase-like enolase superfamily enzyme